jgi:hypothetical protein
MYDGICMFLSPPVHCYIALKDSDALWIRYGEEGGEVVDQDGAVAFLNKLGLTKEECEDRRYVFLGLHSISYGVPRSNLYGILSGFESFGEMYTVA